MSSNQKKKRKYKVDTAGAVTHSDGMSGEELKKEGGPLHLSKKNAQLTKIEEKKRYEHQPASSSHHASGQSIRKEDWQREKKRESSRFSDSGKRSAVNSMTNANVTIDVISTSLSDSKQNLEKERDRARKDINEIQGQLKNTRL